MHKPAGGVGNILHGYRPEVEVAVNVLYVADIALAAFGVNYICPVNRKSQNSFNFASVSCCDYVLVRRDWASHGIEPAFP